MQNRSSFFGGLSLQAVQHRRRCEQLPALRAGEAEDLVAAYLASRGATVCPVRYAAPVEQLPQYSRSMN